MRLPRIQVGSVAPLFLFFPSGLGGIPFLRDFPSETVQITPKEAKVKWHGKDTKIKCLTYSSHP